MTTPKIIGKFTLMHQFFSVCHRIYLQTRMISYLICLIFCRRMSDSCWSNLSNSVQWYSCSWWAFRVTIQVSSMRCETEKIWSLIMGYQCRKMFLRSTFSIDRQTLTLFINRVEQGEKSLSISIRCIIGWIDRWKGKDYLDDVNQGRRLERQTFTVSSPNHRRTNPRSMSTAQQWKCQVLIKRMMPTKTF